MEITLQGIQMDEQESERLVPDSQEIPLPPKICIYRISTTIPKTNQVAYIPQVISIGPIHFGNPKLEMMEMQKHIYMDAFCKRVSKKTKKNLQASDLFRIIINHEEHIRNCYADYYPPSDEFLYMVLFDAVFIIEFVLRGLNPRYINDFIIVQPVLRKMVLLDLFLLENQLPYFVLDILYAELKEKEKFFKLVCDCFLIDNQNQVFNSLEDDKMLHFVGLMRYILCGAPQNWTWDSYRIKLKYSASKLHQAGVVFKVAEGCKSLLDINFESGVLKMPILEVDENFETVLKNVMALEQCHYQCESYICNYIFLMDHLINTAEDVDLLTEAGVIIHWLGSNKMMANLINNLCKGVEIYGSNYNNICRQLNEHYEDPYNHRKATLKLVYFSNLWRGTATVIATLLLIMTLIQTICSIKSLY
ncbi:hypothetical protein P3X46_025110 [Hevea brasiliensis]|uniref:Uncharacterized protein n=2 Tax=Hevea brasiliensis TaxID=3981 RepID=A0ABQ9L6A1_HEVBR|nr:hypothetical protein P3X46_025110 [Hevea brasiliensis]